MPSAAMPSRGAVRTSPAPAAQTSKTRWKRERRLITVPPQPGPGQLRQRAAADHVAFGILDLEQYHGAFATCHELATGVGARAHHRTDHRAGRADRRVGRGQARRVPDPPALAANEAERARYGRVSARM